MMNGILMVLLFFPVFQDQFFKLLIRILHKRVNVTLLQSRPVNICDIFFFLRHHDVPTPRTAIGPRALAPAWAITLDVVVGLGIETLAQMPAIIHATYRTIQRHHHVER